MLCCLCKQNHHRNCHNLQKGVKYNMMKYFKTVAVSSLAACLLLASCGMNQVQVTASMSANNKPAVLLGAPGAKSVSSEASDISERAMENFLKKVEAGNYSIVSDTFMTANVCSNDLVYFNYVQEANKDYVYMSVGNEVYKAYPGSGGLSDLSFEGEGHAVDLARSKLLNYFTDEAVSQGNIYNIFYNSPEEPLTFSSYEQSLKRFLLNYVDYGEMVLPLMHEVKLELDSEDPQTAHLTCRVDDSEAARIYNDDIDLVIKFGEAESNPQAEEWMSNPVYPQARTGWNDVDVFILDSVFMPGYGELAVPYPDFASYAMKNDEESFFAEDTVRIRDSHASEADLHSYIAKLLNNGFTEVTETAEDGTVHTYYRKLLREKYRCYSQIEVSFNDGFNLAATKYYDFPVYHDLSDINGRISACGFPLLKESAFYSAVMAQDVASFQSESWSYFYTYDMVLYTDFDIIDESAAESYLAEYEKAVVEAGFHPIQDGDEISWYKSANGCLGMTYRIANGKLSFIFKSQEHLSREETENMIKEAGYPEIHLDENLYSHDTRAYVKSKTGVDYRLCLEIDEFFQSAEEAERFLDEYEALLKAAGFERIPHDEAATTRPIAIYNSEKDMLVGIQLVPNGENTMVSFEFKAG